MKKILSIILIFLLLISINIMSYAGVQISEENPGTDWKPTATNAYQVCYDMRYPTSSLGDNTLDPHLMLNADWGAMLYLGASAYGGISSSSATSSTGNETGVKDIQGTGGYLYTSSNIEGGTVHAYFANIYNNKGTRYVETLPKNKTKENTSGLAISETSQWYGGNYGYSFSGVNTILIRTALFGYTSDGYYGKANNCKFRPVIWN